MPTVHRAHGLRFVIYLDDHPPPHLHVVGDGIAKIAVDKQEVRLVSNRGLSKADIKRALDTIQEQREMMLEAWKRVHG